MRRQLRRGHRALGRGAGPLRPSRPRAFRDRRPHYREVSLTLWIKWTGTAIDEGGTIMARISNLLIQLDGRGYQYWQDVPGEVLEELNTVELTPSSGRIMPRGALRDLSPAKAGETPITPAEKRPGPLDGAEFDQRLEAGLADLAALKNRDRTVSE